MIPNLIDRFLGRTAKARNEVEFSITSLTTSAYAVGDVLNVGGVTYPLQCVSISKGEPVDFVKITVWEVRTTGSMIAPDLKVHIFDTDFSPPAQNAAFLGSTSATTHRTTITIPASAWVSYTANYAMAEVVVSGARVKPLDDSRTVYAVATIESVDTFGTDAELHFLIDIDC